MSRIIADLLRRKAQGDFNAAVVLAQADPAMDDETVGLHLQQAVEKAAKAVLARRGVKYPVTHDINALLLSLANHGDAVPERFAELDTLTLFATQARYERAVPAGALDRAAYLSLVRDFLAWTDSAS